MFTSIHLLTFDCDTPSKVGTKRAAYQAAIDLGYGLLRSFEKEMTTQKKWFATQNDFLFTGVSTFDDLR